MLRYYNSQILKVWIILFFFFFYFNGEICSCVSVKLNLVLAYEYFISSLHKTWMILCLLSPSNIQNFFYFLRSKPGLPVIRLFLLEKWIPVNLVLSCRILCFNLCHCLTYVQVSSPTYL